MIRSKLVKDPRTLVVKLPDQFNDWRVSEICRQLPSCRDAGLLKKALIDAAAIYEGGCKANERFASVADQRRALEVVGGQAGQLLSNLERLGYKLEGVLKDAGTKINDETLRNVKEGLKTLAVATKIARHQIPKGRGGRPSEAALKNLIRRLASIYVDTTEQKTLPLGYDPREGKYSGDFFLFVEACLYFVDVDRSDEALGKSIQRALAGLSKS